MESPHLPPSDKGEGGLDVCLPFSIKSPYSKTLSQMTSTSETNTLEITTVRQHSSSSMPASFRQGIRFIYPEDMAHIQIHNHTIPSLLHHVLITATTVGSIGLAYQPNKQDKRHSSAETSHYQEKTTLRSHQ